MKHLTILLLVLLPMFGMSQRSLTVTPCDVTFHFEDRDSTIVHKPDPKACKRYERKRTQKKSRKHDKFMRSAARAIKKRRN